VLVEIKSCPSGHRADQMNGRIVFTIRNGKARGFVIKAFSGDLAGKHEFH
jgi:hypothetical protein